MTWFFREIRGLLAVLAAGAAIGAVTWALTLPPGHYYHLDPDKECPQVTATCPFTDPGMYRKYQGQPVYRIWP